MQLPAAFIDKYLDLLGPVEGPAFIEALTTGQAQAGYRVNPLHATLTPDDKPVPGVATGYFGKVSGKSLDHVTGWVYSQEPSAMQVGEIVDPQPGETVLDLCAAPGGKSTHLIGKMADQGLLVANEIFPKRAKILAENLERWGAQHVAVTNESPETLEKVFPQFFDRILVDAPCSGEGMFRKEPDGIQYWTPNYPAECANRQRHILTSAMKMLKPGGTLVYSTCTFAPEEDEQMIAWLLAEYPDLSVVPIAKQPGMDEGRPAWADGNPALAQTVRFFPHHYDGEGHFIAKLQLAGTPMPAKKRKKKQRGSAVAKPSREQQALWDRFKTEHVPTYTPTNLVVFGDELYDVTLAPELLSQLKVAQAGVHLGTFKKKRFEPAFALALVANASQSLAINHDQWAQYVHGDTFTVTTDCPNGWYVLTCDQHHCGWGKLVNGTVKNFYPKGLRFAL